MQKSILFPAFLTAAIATGLFATPTKATPSQEKRVSVADAAEIYQPDERTTNLAATSNLADRTWLDTASENSSTDNLNKIIGITGLSLGAGFIAYRLNRTNKPSLTNSFPYGNTNTLLLDRLSPKLRKKLLQLIHNRETANRLLTGTMLNHADRSPNWLAEKVIYDLERDRL
jgi:hypothetical protein